MSVFKTERDNVEQRFQQMCEAHQASQKRYFEIVNEHKINEEKENILEELDNIDEKDKNHSGTNLEVEKMKERHVKECFNRSLGTLNSRLEREGFDETLNQVIFEMVYNACWIDDAVKEGMIGHMYDTYNTVIEHLDTILKPVAAYKDSLFIKNAKECIMEACKRSAGKITEDTASTALTIDDINQVHFFMNDEDADMLDDDLSDLGKEEIEDMVKQKVLTVIQDEKNAGKQKADMFKEMDDTLRDDGSEDSASPDTETGANESFIRAKRLYQNRIVTESVGNSLFESIMISTTKSVDDEILIEGLDMGQDSKMNTAFLESIIVYTVLETVNTLKLYDFTTTNVRQLSKSFINKVH